MNITTSSLLVITALGLSLPTESMVWRPVKDPHAQHHNNRRAAKQFTLQNASDAQVRMLTPTQQSVPLQLENGRIKFKSTGMDNYHALVAEQQTGKLKKAAIRYVYMHGKPSGHSPSALTDRIKTDFDIIPSPLPREHWRYTARKEAVFKLRYQTSPVSDVEVSLLTTNGSWLKTKSDKEGIARFIMPDDFPEVKPGRRNNPAAEFSVSAKYQSGETQHQTILSAPYSVSPQHWQSLGYGALVAVAGFIVGAFFTGLGRRHKPATNNKKVA